MANALQTIFGHRLSGKILGPQLNGDGIHGVVQAGFFSHGPVVHLPRTETGLDIKCKLGFVYLFANTEVPSGAVAEVADNVLHFSDETLDGDNGVLSQLLKSGLFGAF